MTTLVARREALVLKRRRTGELSEGGIMIGVAGPSTLVSLAGTAVAMVIGGLVSHLPWPAPPAPSRCSVDLLPLSAVMEVARLGWTGLDAAGETLETWRAAAGPLLVVAAWAAVGVLARHRWFRWEPRR